MKKVFITLAVITACVIVGGFMLNTLLPNALTGLTNSIEDSIYSASGMSFDFNKDGVSGGDIKDSYSGDGDKDDKAQSGAGVKGFGK